MPQSIMLALRELYAATEVVMQNEYVGEEPRLVGQRIQARHDLDAAIEAEIAKNGQV